MWQIPCARKRDLLLCSVSLKKIHVWWLRGQETACNAGDLGSVPELGRSPEGRPGNPLQYSCLENPMDRGAWWLQSMGLQRVRHD